MKKVTLVLFAACLIWTVQTVKAQTPDTTKNNIEVKKKVKQGVHGRTVTKVKMTGKGTPDALKEPANGTATGHLAPKPAVEPVVVTPPPASPAVVVVHDTVHQNAPAAAPAPRPRTTTTQVTTTTETRPVVTKTTTTHHVVATKKTYHKPVHSYHKTYSKTAVGTPTTKTVTTTTVKKTQ